MPQGSDTTFKNRLSELEAKIAASTKRTQALGKDQRAKKQVSFTVFPSDLSSNTRLMLMLRRSSKNLRAGSH
jgi:hypothetical protein